MSTIYPYYAELNSKSNSTTTRIETKFIAIIIIVDLLYSKSNSTTTRIETLELLMFAMIAKGILNQIPLQQGLKQV